MKKIIATICILMSAMFPITAEMATSCYALELNGTSQYLDLDEVDKSGFDAADTDHTFEFWTALDDADHSGGARVIYENRDGPSGGWYLQWRTGARGFLMKIKYLLNFTFSV